MVAQQERSAEQSVQIPAPRFSVANFRIVGTSPYVQHRFSKKAKEKMRGEQAAGSQSKSRKAREARDFDAEFQQAMYLSKDGWNGIPAGSFRAASISACRLVGFKMTLAKLSLFIEADGYDAEEGIDLVRIYGEPVKVEHMVRIQQTTSIAVRAMWREWYADLRIRYDEGQFSVTDVANLLSRVGMQVGIGEGRPDSKSSTGMGWGLFRIDNLPS